MDPADNMTNPQNAAGNNVASQESSEHNSFQEKAYANALASERHTQNESSVGELKACANAKSAQEIDPAHVYYKPWVQSYPDVVPEYVDTHMFENLVELFESSIEKNAKNTAFVSMGSSITYEKLGAEVLHFATFLQLGLGLGKGDTIAIMMPNLLQFPIAFFGALKAGLTVTNINPLYTPRELQFQLDNSDATAIVVIANYAHNLEEIINDTKVKHVIITEVGDGFVDLLGLKRTLINTVVHFRGMVPAYDKSNFPNCISFNQALSKGRHAWQDFRRVEISYNDIALLQYTGGTTGRSKGAMISHGNLIANVAQAMGMYGKVLRGNEETILTVLPLYHIFALTINLILFIHIGAKNILITDPRNIKSFINDIKAHPEISALTGVNTLFNLFVTHEEFKDLKWNNLHIVIGGGAAVQSGVEQRFFENTGIHILEGYGLTECSPLCAVCPHTVDHYTGSIGLIVPSTVARIVDGEGNEIRDTIHEGELEIKGPQVMQGYYKSEKHNEFIFDDGFVRTGDIAKWMEGGYIKLIDRLKDMILVSGFNVFPNEIEDVVSRFNRVLECAVIGVPSESTGEAVKLFVVKKDPSLTEEELRHYCRAYLTPYKVPRIIQFVDSLPKSALGKVLRRKLRELDAELSKDGGLSTANAAGDNVSGALSNASAAQSAAANEANAANASNAAASMNNGTMSGASSAQNAAAQGDAAKAHGAMDDSSVSHAAASVAAQGQQVSPNETILAAPGVDINDSNVSHQYIDLELTAEQKVNAVAKPVDFAELHPHAYHEDELSGKPIIPESYAKAAAQMAEASGTKSEDVVPVKKSAGAIALERLLSSHHAGLEAGVDTPNIHHMHEKSALVRQGRDDSRSHVGPAHHELDDTEDDRD